MPIHLPSTSRRRFLKSSSGAVLASVLPWSDASAVDGKKEVWALLSDTHIAADRDTVSRQGVNMAANLKHVVAELAAERENLTGVIVDGDCAYLDGQRGDYDSFAGLMAPLIDAGLPIHMTLGNHDDRRPFYESFSDLRPQNPVVDGKHVSVVRGGNANWVFLDSLRYVNKVEGEIGATQLEWVKKVLVEFTDKPVILVGHHYPQVFRDDVIPGKEKIRISGLVDSEPFLKVIAQHPQVKAYVFGHSHDWGIRTADEGCHFVNLPPTAYVFKPERPNGWVKATVTAEGMTLELKAIDPDHAEHGKAHEVRWR